MNFRTINYSIRAFLKGMRYSSGTNFFILKKGSKIISAPILIFHEVLNHFDEFYDLRENKNIELMDLTDDVVVLEKNGKRMIFKAPYAGEIAIALKNFDFFFKQIPNDGTIDFTKGVSFFGFIVKTTPSMILEIDYALLKYNEHHALKEGDVVLDCGAYTGTYSLWASKQVGRTGKVYALEPDPKNFEILKENISRNEIANVIPVNAGIYDSTGLIDFQDGNGVASKFGEGNMKVQVYSLEDFFNKYLLNKIDFIKMDIESAEVDAIRGAKEFLKNHPTSLSIASYHLLDGVQTFKLLEREFSEIGYSCVTENPKHLTTYATSRL